MIVDVRIYNIVPRKMGEYLRLFEEYGLPVQRRHIGDPLGYFVTEHGQLSVLSHEVTQGIADVAPLHW